MLNLLSPLSPMMVNVNQVDDEICSNVVLMALDAGEFGSQYAVHLTCAQAICLSASLSQPACFFAPRVYRAD